MGVELRTGDPGVVEAGCLTGLARSRSRGLLYSIALFRDAGLFSHIFLCICSLLSVLAYQPLLATYASRRVSFSKGTAIIFFKHELSIRSMYFGVCFLAGWGLGWSWARGLDMTCVEP